MIPQAIKDLGMKHVAVMYAHNTEDFFGKFDGVFLCEAPINPTAHGLTLFTWDLPQKTLASDIDPLVGEVIYFYDLNKLVGLDAVVVYDQRLENNIQNSLYIAHQIKFLMPATKVLMYTTESRMQEVSVLSQNQPQFDLPTSYAFYAAAHAARIAGRENSYRCSIPACFDAITNNPIAICDLLGIDHAPRQEFGGIFGAASLTDTYQQILPALGNPHEVFVAGVAAAKQNGMDLLDLLPEFESIEWDARLFRRPGLTY